MIRRRFPSLAAAAALVALSLTQGAAAAPLDYSPGVLEQHLEADEVVLLDFRASWGLTCAEQADVLEHLRQEHPAFARAITFIDVDWDTWGESRMADGLRVTRRSTLIVLKGDREIGRLVAVTDEREIRRLLEAALASATSA